MQQGEIPLKASGSLSGIRVEFSGPAVLTLTRERAELPPERSARALLPSVNNLECPERLWHGAGCQHSRVVSLHLKNRTLLLAYIPPCVCSHVFGLSLQTARKLGRPFTHSVCLLC